MVKTVSAARTLQWKINNFTLNSILDKTDVFSDDFVIFLDNHETVWYLSFTIDELELGVYLHMKRSEIENFAVNCNFYIHKVNGQSVGHKYINCSHQEFLNGDYGIENFKSFKEILNSDRYLVNDSITLEIKIELTKKIKAPIATSNPYLAINKEYFASKVYSDFILICSDNAEIPIHRYILAGFSPVLKTLFDIKTENGQNRIIVTDIDGPTMKEILRFVYTQEVQNVKDLAPKLLHGAHKYEINDLMKICGAEMIKDLTIGNALEYFILAEKYGLKALLVRSATFIKMHPKIFHNNWNRLEKKQLFTLSECFRQNYETIQVFETTL